MGFQIDREFSYTVFFYIKEMEKNPDGHFSALAGTFDLILAEILPWFRI